MSTFVWILNWSGGKDSVASENLSWARAVASVPIAGKNIYKNIDLKNVLYICNFLNVLHRSGALISA